MREVCPIELSFELAIDKGKDSLRKGRQRHNEALEAQRARATREENRPNNQPAANINNQRR